MDDQLVWKVCESILDCFHHCQKCPGEIDTPYGKAKQGCRLHAEETIDLVMQHSSASPVTTTEKNDGN